MVLTPLFKYLLAVASGVALDEVVRHYKEPIMHAFTTAKQMVDSSLSGKNSTNNTSIKRPRVIINNDVPSSDSVAIQDNCFDLSYIKDLFELVNVDINGDSALNQLLIRLENQTFLDFFSMCVDQVSSPEDLAKLINSRSMVSYKITSSSLGNGPYERESSINQLMQKYSIPHVSGGTIINDVEALINHSINSGFNRISAQYGDRFDSFIKAYNTNSEHMLSIFEQLIDSIKFTYKTLL